ncbi:MAG: tandem-95 repeat protein [Verrucomicrobia bacterium]|nr:tandem-95 repeat protein [Verrucomicrobiota bacterium]
MPAHSQAAGAPPSVALTSPLHGAYAVAPATVRFTATASDSDGSVTNVEFYSGTNKLASVTNAPYQFAWTGVAAGSYSLTAVARDNSGLATTSAVASITVLTNGSAIKVMPLGDSITEGGGFSSPYPGAYRVRLWADLAAAGLNVDFVGSGSNGPAELGDKDHEGHSGWLIGPDVPVNQNGLYNSLGTWLSNAQPHVVLLLIGANDVIQNYDFANAPTRLANLIDRIHAVSSNTHVIVSSLTPFRDTDLYNRSKSLNAQMPGIVAARQAAGKRISFVDGTEAMTRFDLTDGIHPTTNGYSQLGDFWFGALLPVITCSAPPEVTLTAPTNGATFTAPANLTLTAAATNFGGLIQRVEFYQDDLKIGEATNAPWSLTVNGVTSGRFRFSARAVATNGAASSSATSTVQDQWQFIRGININGGAVTIEGYDWLDYSSATSLGFGFTSAVTLSSPNDYGFTLNPLPYDPNLLTMFQRLAYQPNSSQPLSFAQSLNNGSYRVYLWLLEDFGDYSRTLDFKVQGTTVATNVFNVPKGTWQKFGPYVAIVTNGQLTADLQRNSSGGPAIFGVTIFKADSTNTPPILSTLTNLTIYQNSSTGPLPIYVTDDYTAASNLVLSATSSNTTLVPTNLIVLGGSGFSRTLTVTPATNIGGTSLITVTATDGGGLTNSTSFTLTVIGNTVPTASNQTVTASEDVAKAITLTGSDAESPTLTYFLVRGPTNGTLSGFNTNTGALTYLGNSNFFGADSFLFNVFDSQLTSPVPGTVTITVTNVNDAPVASNQSVTLPEDVATNLVLRGFDVEGSNLTFTVVNLPTNGALSVFNTNTGALTYRPVTNYFGSDSFTFSVSDGQLTSAVATVSLTITPVNDAPVASNQSVTLPEDTATNLTLAGFDVEGSNLTFAVVVGPAHGALSGFDTNAGTLTYLPVSNYFGADSFTFSVSDGQSTSAVATVSLTITAVNDAPVASNQSVTLPEDTATNLTLAGFDVEGSNLTFTVVNPPTNGTLSAFNTNTGALTYRPVTNYFGTDSFTFSVSDGQLTSAVATASLTITPVNDAPVASNQSVTLPEDTATNLVLRGFDVEGSNLTFTVVSQPTNGALSAFNTNAGTLTYLPVTNFFGADSFTFSVSDGQLTSAVATVSLTITAVNDAPVASNQSVTLPEDTATNLVLRGGDVEGSNLTFTVVSPPGNGTLSAFNTNTGALTYLPVTNYFGADSFTFSVSDGQLTSAVATVSLTITAVNDAPVASNQSVTLPEDTATNLTLTGFDVDGPVTNFTIATLPAHGTLSGTAPNVTYTPATNYNGPDAFTFTVDDGALTSAVATVSLTVTPVNDAPTAFSQSLTNAEDTSLAITLTAFDVDGPVTNFVIATPPAHGALSGTAPNLSYLPATNYNGPDSFTFTVNDGSLTSAVATVSLTITPVNDAPVAFAQSQTLAEDTGLALTLTGADVDSTNLTFAIVTGPTNGVLLNFNATNGAVTYLPNTNFFGADAFTFSVSDGALTSAAATVTLTITNVNDAPVAFAQSRTLAEDTALALTLTGADVDSTNLTFVIVTAPTNGVLLAFDATNGTATYLPNTNFFGPDSFTFSASDGALTSSPATVTLTITNVNDAPVAFAQSRTLAEDTSLALTLTAADVDSTNLIFILVSSPTNGGLSAFNATNGTVTYLPVTNFHGPDSFTFSVSDGALTSAVAVVTLNVTNVNDTPVAFAQSQTLAEDTSLALTLTGADVDSPVLTFIIVTGPTNGVLQDFSPDDGTVTYLPNTNFFGADAFTFSVSDGALTSAAATVTLTVTNVNDAPVAFSQSLTNAEDAAWPITLTGLDVDGPLTNFTVVDVPTNGVLRVLDTNGAVLFTVTNGMSLGATNALSYLPATNFFGEDAFTFTVDDGALTSEVATVSLTITNVNDAPVAFAQSQTLAEDTPTPLTLAGTDIDSPNLTFLIVAGPTNGALLNFNATNGTVTYRPNTNFFGSDAFTFAVSDGALTSAAAVVSLTITNVNDAPVAFAQSQILAEDTSLVLTLAGADVDSTNLTFVLVTGPTNGALTGFNATNGTVTYMPATNFFGADAFTFSVSDGALTSAVAVVSLTITNVNDAPVAFAQSQTLAEDTSIALTLAGADIDSSNLTYLVVTGPTNGTLAGFNATNGTLTYRPNTNFFGADSFTFSVSDGALTSAAAVVSLTITNVNDAPVAQAQSVTVGEDTPAAITLVGTDVDSTNLTFILLRGPTNGTLTSFNTNTGAATYLGGTNFFGADSFVFNVSDGQLTGAVPATVSITVTNINDPPVANSQSAGLLEDTSLALTLTGSDIDSTNLTFLIVTPPAHGVLSAFNATNGHVTYTPATNYFGADAFTFAVSDGSLTSAAATVSLTITNVNDPPVAGNLSLSVPANTNSTRTLAATDPDGDALTFALTSAPTNGLLTAFNATNGAFTYTPAHAFAGKDAFTFTVSDGVLTATGAVQLTVVAQTDANTNGIPDAWEDAYFGGRLAPEDPDADPDGDGFTNLQEYLADTNPRDPRSALAITAVQPGATNNTFVVTWSAMGGVRYRLRFSNGDTNGAYTGSFTSVPRGIAEEMCPAPIGTATNLTFLDDGSLTGPTTVPGLRYFRIEAVKE